MDWADGCGASTVSTAQLQAAIQKAHPDISDVKVRLGERLPAAIIYNQHK